MKLQLPSVTLICVDCVDAVGAAKVLEICKTKADFGAVKLLTSIPIEYKHRVDIKPLTSLIMYSVFMLTHFSKYIDTDHVLIVQQDGWILNPKSFKPEWLQLDYVAPLFMQMDMVGSGGFSLRSKRLINHATVIHPEWDGTEGHANRIQHGLGYYEDGVISLSKKFTGFKIATLSQGADFAQGGNRNAHYFREHPFGFHRTWQQIDFNTGSIDSSDISRDITQGYLKDINDLY